ncbi:MAG: extracellular solute-binding protein, partial [Thermotogae bacterium]|nr:extracellular solute-binding protein [Thermotogota bacterium]
YKVAFMQGGYLSGPFGDGKVAMYIGSSAGMPYVARASKGKHEWTWAPIPKWKEYAPPFAGTDVVIFSTATEEQKKAAWKFLKFLISPDITTFWAIKTGYMPVRKSALETKAWKSYVESNPMIEVPVKQIPYGSIDPKPAQWAEIRNIVTTAVTNAMYQKQSVEEALAWAEKEIERILEEK